MGVGSLSVARAGGLSSERSERSHGTAEFHSGPALVSAGSGGLTMSG